VHGARMAQYTPDEVAHKVREAWRAMAPERAAPYEAAAAKERDAWEAARRAYAGLQQTYQQLHMGAQQSGACARAREPPASECGRCVRADAPAGSSCAAVQMRMVFVHVHKRRGMQACMKLSQ